MNTTDKLGRDHSIDLTQRYAEEQPFNDKGIIRVEHRITRLDTGTYHGWYGLYNGAEYGLVVSKATADENQDDMGLAVKASAERFAELNGFELQFIPHKSNA